MNKKIPVYDIPAISEYRNEDIFVSRVGSYASLLYITLNHLNALCNDLLGVPAGEVIRNRLFLEAKRLLVNLDLTISEISVLLNFTDNS